MSAASHETFIDGFGQRVQVHPQSQDCLDQGCCIHNPSDHPLVDAPLSWRIAGPFDIKPSHMERVCEHGVGHPDPDALAYLQRSGKAQLAADLSIHGCDGCCSGHGPKEPETPQPGPRSRLSTLASRAGDHGPSPAG